MLQEPVQLEDDGATVNVTSLVRFQPEHDDIRHGVSLSREGCSMLPAAFFPLDAVTQRSEPVIPGWTDNFSFPSAFAQVDSHTRRQHYSPFSPTLYLPSVTEEPQYMVTIEVTCAG